MAYDFSQLNDKEFEAIVADLLSIYFGKRIERFKPGKDGGVDGRFYSDSDKETIIQCKHYLKTGYSGLISKLKNDEAKKVNKLSPENYIFVTSLPLSGDNKKEIKEIFSPYLKREDDIFGQEDLNDILSNNSKVEEKYFKLWITSTNVFDRIINNAIKGRSQNELVRIQENSHKYVQTNNHERAIKMLEENHVVIISGEPGIGKTVLADNLALFYVSKGFEFIDIQGSISEAENVYKPETRQVYYFDDFLGSNYFEIIEDKKDSHVVKFIDRIKRDKSKRFILTSRTNIFKSGLLHSPVFSTKSIEQQEYLIKITSLSELDRAKILYNHIWFSDLTEEYIDELYIDKRYKEIIKHKNFSPRLIQFITDVNRVKDKGREGYWDYIVKTLDNPVDIWEDSFKRQSNSYVRALVNLTVINGGTIREEDLRDSYNELIEFKNLKNPSHTEKDFRSMSELAVKSFLNRENIYREIEFSLFNPSIADYVLKEHSTDLRELKNIFKALGSVKSLIQLFSLQSEKIISIPHAKKLKQFLFNDPSIHDKSLNYQLYLAYQLKDEENYGKQIKNLIKKVISTKTSISQFSKFVALLIKFRNSIKIENFDFIISVAGSHYLDESDIKAYGKFIDVFNVDDQDVINHFREETDSFLREELDNVKSDVDLSKYLGRRYVNHLDSWEPEDDEDGVKNELHDLASELLNDLNSDAINNLDLDISSYVNEIDVSQMFVKYLKSIPNPLFEDTDRTGKYNSSTDIDDLFERT